MASPRLPPPPPTQQSFQHQPSGPAKLVSGVPVPSTPGPDQLLVRTCAAALNPSDWMAEDANPNANPRAGCTAGTDYAGVVVGVGSALVGEWRVGERVAGFSSAIAEANSAGAFAEYVLGLADLAVRIPDDLPFEEASTLGMGVLTASQALFQTLRLPLPDVDVKQADPNPHHNKTKSGSGKSAQTQTETQTETGTQKETVLVYAGSTATGALAIQLAKLSGARVVATCSPRNRDYLVTSLGADAVFDSNDAELAPKVRDATRNALARILDCIGTPATATVCAACFGTPPPTATISPTSPTSPTSSTTSPCSPISPTSTPSYTYAPLLPVPASVLVAARSDLVPYATSTFRLVYTCGGRGFRLGPSGAYYPPSAEDRAFGRRVMRVVEALLREPGNGRRRLRCHRLEVLPRGLAGVREGLDRLRAGKVSGRKLVVRIADTPREKGEGEGGKGEGKGEEGEEGEENEEA